MKTRLKKHTLLWGSNTRKNSLKQLVVKFLKCQTYSLASVLLYCALGECSFFVTLFLPVCVGSIGLTVEQSGASVACSGSLKRGKTGGIRRTCVQIIHPVHVMVTRSQTT